MHDRGNKVVDNVAQLSLYICHSKPATWHCFMIPYPIPLTRLISSWPTQPLYITVPHHTLPNHNPHHHILALHTPPHCAPAHHDLPNPSPPSPTPVPWLPRWSPLSRNTRVSPPPDNMSWTGRTGRCCSGLDGPPRRPRNTPSYVHLFGDNKSKFPASPTNKRNTISVFRTNCLLWFVFI